MISVAQILLPPYADDPSRNVLWLIDRWLHEFHSTCYHLWAASLSQCWPPPSGLP